MNPLVTQVQPCDDFSLIVTFENGEVKRIDIAPYMKKGVFKELSELNYFKQVRVSYGSIEWPHEQDLSHDTLYLVGKSKNHLTK